MDTYDPPKVGRTFYSKDNTLWQVQANYSREFNGHNIDVSPISPV